MRQYQYGFGCTAKVLELQLKGGRRGGFVIHTEEIQASKDECLRSLIGKLYGKKLANYTGHRNTLCKLSSFIGPIKYREFGLNLYQIVFASQNEKLQIQHGKVWTFDAQFLILKPLTEDMEI